MSRTSATLWLVVAAVVPTLAILLVKLLVDDRQYGITDGVPVTVAIARGVLLVGIIVQLVALCIALVAIMRRRLPIFVCLAAVLLSAGYLFWALPLASRF